MNDLYLKVRILIVKINRYIRNKYYVFAFKRHIIKHALEKVENYREYLDAFLSESRSGNLVIKFKDGFQLTCRHNDLSAVGETCILEDYQRDQATQIKPGDVVFDVGAHIGSFAIYAAKKGARVYAFEPQRENFELLLENIRSNHLEDAITPIQKGVYYFSGTLDFFHDPKNTGGNSVFLTQGFETGHNIMVDTVENFARQFNLTQIDLLKIDIEGAEYEIFRHLKPQEWNLIKKIVGEYHLSFAYRDNYFTIRRLLGPHYPIVKYYSPYYFFAAGQ